MDRLGVKTVTDHQQSKILVPVTEQPEGVQYQFQVFMPSMLSDIEQDLFFGRHHTGFSRLFTQCVGILGHGIGRAVFDNGDIAVIAVRVQHLSRTVRHRPHAVDRVVEAHDLRRDELCQRF